MSAAVRAKRAGVVVICALFAACLLTGCDWAMYGLGPNHSFNNATETNIAPGTVSQLQKATTFSGPSGATLNERVVVAEGMVYASADVVTPTEPDHAIYAFSEKGNTNCTGTPRQCTPVWGAKLPG